ncbi:MAG: methyltransferase [Halioglobus sp.]
MPSDLAPVFHRLDELLTDNHDLWRSQPFTTGDLPWRHTHRHLHAALLDLSDAAVLRLHDHPQQLVGWLREKEPKLGGAVCAFEPNLTGTPRDFAFDRHDSVNIPGRKWEQIQAFTRSLPQYKLPVVDWCAGKGHLSRIVQRSQQQPVHCLEWDASLVAAGRQLAAEKKLEIYYHHHDVMLALPAACAGADSVHVGLHACGVLHHRLLQHVAGTAAKAVAVSPCCYHKIASGLYRPLSLAAGKTCLSLDRRALHLAVQDTVTARGGERRLRERERIWRLAFDALQRDLRATEDYLNVPSVKRELLRQDFPRFCRWAANTRQLTLPGRINYERYLRRGSEKHREIVRLELLRKYSTGH